MNDKIYDNSKDIMLMSDGRKFTNWEPKNQYLMKLKLQLNNKNETEFVNYLHKNAPPNLNSSNQIIDSSDYHKNNDIYMINSINNDQTNVLPITRVEYANF
jgi:hypothetical protein